MKFKQIIKIFIFIVVFILPFYIFRFKIGPVRTNPFEISVFVIFLLFVIEQISSKRLKKTELGGIWPLIFLVVAALSILQTDNFITGLGIFKGWFLAPYLLYIMVVNTFDDSDLPYLSIPMFCSLILVSVWVYFQKTDVIQTLVYQVGDGSFNQYLSEGRLFGPFESPNFLAMFISPVFFLSLPLLTKVKNQIVKILVGIIFLLPIAALYLSGSRGGLFAFGISIFVLIFLLFLPSFKRYTFLISIAKIIGLVVANIIYLYLFLRIKFPSGAGSDMIRQEIYDYAVKVLHNNWLLGIGLGTFQEEVKSLSVFNFSFQEFGLPYALHPHNLLLAVWLNLGLGGLIAFLFIIGKFVRQAIQLPKGLIRASAGAAMTAILVHGLFDTTYFKNDLSALFWLSLAFPVLLVAKPKNNENFNK